MKSVTLETFVRNGMAAQKSADEIIAEYNRKAAMRNKKERGARLAVKLKKGDKVRCLLDSGSAIQTTLVDDPYLLGGHTWVAKLEGVSGVYDITRLHQVS